jgi:hypothetical protein
MGVTIELNEDLVGSMRTRAETLMYILKSGSMPLVSSSRCLSPVVT